MDVSAVEDPVQRRALETMIKTYGQTPRQLFNGSHISRAAPRVMMEGELPAAMGILVHLAFREPREQAKEIVCPVTSSDLSSPFCAEKAMNSCTVYEMIGCSSGSFHFLHHRARCHGSKV